MTPAINYLKKQGVTHQVLEYQHDSNASSFGLEAAEKLNVTANKVFKTLVVSTNNNELAVAVLPVTHQLSLKNMAKLLNCKKVTMADKLVVQRATGYVLGGVSPFGQKKRLSTWLDASAKDLAHIYISAGQRGLEIQIAPYMLIEHLTAQFAELALAS